MSAPDARYVVRNGFGLKRYVHSTDPKEAAMSSLSRALRFSLQGARACADAYNARYPLACREVFEVSYVLKWYDDEGKQDGDYFGETLNPFVCTRQRAERFASKAEAKASEECQRYGAARHVSGWKPVALLKRVRA